MNHKQIAMNTIKEGMQILRDFGNARGNESWVKHSTARRELDILAQALGYKDAIEVENIVCDEEESTRDMYPGDWFDWI